MGARDAGWLRLAEAVCLLGIKDRLDEAAGRRGGGEDWDAFFGGGLFQMTASLSGRVRRCRERMDAALAGGAVTLPERRPGGHGVVTVEGARALRFRTLRECARCYGVSEKTVRRALRSGRPLGESYPSLRERGITVHEDDGREAAESAGGMSRPARRARRVLAVEEDGTERVFGSAAECAVFYGLGEKAVRAAMQRRSPVGARTGRRIHVSYRR